MPPSHRSRCFSLAQITRSATAHWPSIDFQARRGEVLGVVAGRLQHLDHLGVVEVGDEAHGHARHVAQQLRRQPLGHHHVVRCDRLEQPVEVGQAGLEQLDRRVAERRSGRAPPP